MNVVHWATGEPVGHTTTKIVCVGRNYAAHAYELGNPLPDAPLLFIKPETALADFHAPVVIPHGQGAVHHECEIALLLGGELKQASAEYALHAVAGIGLALDLTLRDVQDELKRNGQPWERAKAFDGACPVSGFVSAADLDFTRPLTLRFAVNDEERQQGSTEDMLWGFSELLVAISSVFTLRAGDIVLTGTPQGVGPLQAGDRLRAQLWQQETGLVNVTTRVV